MEKDNYIGKEYFADSRYGNIKTNSKAVILGLLQNGSFQNIKLLDIIKINMFQETVIMKSNNRKNNRKKKEKLILRLLIIFDVLAILAFIFFFLYKNYFSILRY